MFSDRHHSGDILLLRLLTSSGRDMSKITISLKHDDLLWTVFDGENGLKSYTHSWEDNTITFDDFHIRVTCEVDISDQEQSALVKCLTKEGTTFVPTWGTLTIDVQKTVQRIEKQIWKTARFIDHCFRRSPKGIRLPPLKLSKQQVSQSQQAFPVMGWKFSEEEQKRLSPLYAHLSSEACSRYDKSGVMIPISEFEHKQIHMSDQDVEEIFQYMDTATESPPYWALYGIAWENFAKNKSYDSAILILATSIETALKWCLNQHGDNIANYLIEKLPSPSLDRLYMCALVNTPHEFPKHFQAWLKQLSEARNFVAHKPREVDIEVLQIARWFALGEAILKIITDKENDPLVGYLIEPSGENVVVNFPPDSRGVVLRREKLYHTGEDKFHVIFDSGVSRYFGENSFVKLPDKQQKLPSVE